MSNGIIKLLKYSYFLLFIHLPPLPSPKCLHINIILPKKKSQEENKRNKAFTKGFHPHFWFLFFFLSFPHFLLVKLDYVFFFWLLIVFFYFLLGSSFFGKVIFMWRHLGLGKGRRGLNNKKWGYFSNLIIPFDIVNW